MVQDVILKAESEFKVRFSEVDSMNIVWHGNYALYFEDAREAFGKKYNFEYLTIFENGYYAPLVELKFEYKSPLTYKDKGLVEITFRNTEAAKIIFDYKIMNLTNNQIAATGTSTQVFLDRNHRLCLLTPPFFQEWKRKTGLLN